MFQDFFARLCSTEFLHDPRHADHPTAFSRCRKLPLPTLVAIMLTGMRMSIQAELDISREVSEQAFAQAHAKLSPTAIAGLNHCLIARAHPDRSVLRCCHRTTCCCSTVATCSGSHFKPTMFAFDADSSSN
ncbi:MAG TPA: hypothetical protein VF616_14410 [Duganella sp.]|uniref:hypothetical protein n=1 Tax=Duganella sp. TaxID=1904440 RepID=UPI002ED4228D